jgi:NTE family protein
MSFLWIDVTEWWRRTLWITRRALLPGRLSTEGKEEVMSKTALVLSGGGAKGAFQFMAEKYAREVKGYHWDIIAGVSVGALNGTMLAMEKYDRVEEIWKTITAGQVYTGGLNFWSILKLLFGAKSVYGNEPLWEMLEREVEPDKVKVDLRIGVVSLRTGQYVPFRPSDPGFKKAVLASTAIPLVWTPVDITPEQPDMVDGGVRNYSPLGDVLDAEPEEIVIINCSPRDPPLREKPFKNALEIGMTALNVALNEIFVTDLREFLRIDHNVQQAEACGAVLTNPEGKAYKRYTHHIIEPDEPLGDTMDFSRATLDRHMEAGWEKAKEVLG